jgi:tetratricopeptide (TPR) repeat protein
MTFKVCRQCGASISIEAHTCPHCGFGTPTRDKITAEALAVLVVATVGLFFSPAQPVAPAPPVVPVPHNVGNLTDKYADMTMQQLINSLPEDYIKALSRQKSLLGSGLEAARNTLEMAKFAASLYRTEPDPKVIAIINAIIKKEEHTGPYIYSQGNEYLANKQYDLAIQKFNEGISLGDMKSYDGRGMAWLAKHEYERAIADFTQAAKSERGNYIAYLHRAEANEQKGNRDSAIDDYRRALTLAPDKAISDQIKFALLRLLPLQPQVTPPPSGRRRR